MKTSIVTVNRNDGYKEKERLLIHLRCLLDSFDEVNYVDWNSPTRSLLYEIIDDIPKTGRLKHFAIPPEINEEYKKIVPDFPKCNGSIAINLALRRTNADWFAATTCDNIPPFKHELQQFFNGPKDTFYIFSRREINYNDVLSNKDNLTEYRKFLTKNTKPNHSHAKVTPNDNYSLISCPGDFQLAPTKIWMDIKGFEEYMFFNCFIDTNIQKKVVLNNYKLVPNFDIPMYHMSHAHILPQGHTKALHKNAEAVPKYNDPWKWVEYFQESENDDDWGMFTTDIEHEII